MSHNDDDVHNNQGLAPYAPMVPLIRSTFQVIESTLIQYTASDSPKTNTPESEKSANVDLNNSPNADTSEPGATPDHTSRKTLPVSKVLPLIRNVKTTVVFLRAVLQLYDSAKETTRSPEEEKDEVRSVVYSQAVMQLHDFLRDTTRLLQEKKDEVRFAVDLEGVDLGKPPGSADILQIHNGANNTTYIIDLLTLQHSAFAMTVPGSTLSLRQVLESPTIPKYFHDVRNDSNALWFHYQISLAGTLDTQMMQNVVYTSRDISWSLGNDCEYPRKAKIVGLKACMDEEKLMLTMEEQEEFNRNKELFGKGDDWSMMRIRPMPERVIKYCTNDVKYLLRLADRYEEMMEDEKQKRMCTIESERRIAMSKTEEYEPRANTPREREERTRAPRWHYWRVNTRQHLLLEQQIGSQPVCGPDCARFWEQTHVCSPGCACYATCVARQQENAAWYAAQPLDIKRDWCKRISEAHKEGLRFHLPDVYLRHEETPWEPLEYMPPPADPIDDGDWAEIEQPPSSPWEEEVSGEDEREDNQWGYEESQHDGHWQEDSEQDDAEQDDSEQDDAEQDDSEHKDSEQDDSEHKDLEHEDFQEEDTQQEDTQQEDTQQQDVQQEGTDPNEVKQQGMKPQKFQPDNVRHAHQLATASPFNLSLEPIHNRAIPSWNLMSLVYPPGRKYT